MNFFREIYITDTIFYEYVIQKKMKPTDTFAENDYEQVPTYLY